MAKRLVSIDLSTGHLPAAVEARVLALAAQGEANSGVVPASGDTTGAIDTAAVQAALDALSVTGGVVQVATGLWINDTLVVPSGVALMGHGGSQDNPNLHLAAGANCHMIAVADLAYGWVLANLVLDGHRENQVGAWDGVHLDGTTLNTEFGQCTTGRAVQVTVQYAARDGFFIGNAQIEDRFIDCYAFSCGRHSFYQAGGSDLWFETCTSGESGDDGFALTGSDIRLVSCKSWWSGRQNASRGLSNPGAGSGAAAGFRLNGSIQMTACSAQDNSGPGLVLAGNSADVVAYLDGNGAGAGSNGVAATIDYTNDSLVRLAIGHTSGHVQTPWPLLVGAQTRRSQIVVLADPGGCANPTALRSDSSVNADNVVTFGPVSAGGGSGLTLEDVDDRVAALIVAGTNITKVYDDAGGTLTLSAAGGGGGGGGGATLYDSGPRNISSLFASHGTSGSWPVTLRRIGQRVTWTFANFSWTDSDFSVTIPSGFRPSSTGGGGAGAGRVLGLLVSNDGSQTRPVFFQPEDFYGGGGIKFYSTGAGMNCQVSYDTDDAEPSSLPGSAY